MGEAHQPAKDSAASTLAAILISKTAIATFSIAPFLIGGYIDRLGLTAAEAGQALSIEIFALAISNAFAYLWIAKIDHRSMAQKLLLVLIALNIACIFSNGFAGLVALRAVIGTVEGALLAIGFGLIGKTARPERNFGLFFAVSLSIGAANVRILPLFIEQAGVVGLFVNLCLYALIALAGSLALRQGDFTERAPNAGAAKSGSGVALAPLLPLLVANYVYFIGQGGVWSFFERLGKQFDLPLDAIAGALSVSLLAGVAGGLAASAIDLRFGRTPPLILAIVMAAFSLFLLFGEPGSLGFLAAACLFNFGNNFGHPYILGLAAKIDPSGRLTVLSAALHTGGQATGPFIVGLAVAPPDFTNALWVGVAVFAATIVLIAPTALADARRLLRAKGGTS